MEQALLGNLEEGIQGRWRTKLAVGFSLTMMSRAWLSIAAATPLMAFFHAKWLILKSLREKARFIDHAKCP